MTTLPSLSPVAHSMLLPLWGRARYARFDGTRADPAAEALLAELGVDDAAMHRGIGTYGILAFGRRAAWIDAEARAWLGAHPDGQLVNLGAGLDTLLQRVDNGVLTGLSVDLPEVIALRRAHLPEHPREAMVGARLEDAALCAEFFDEFAAVVGFHLGLDLGHDLRRADVDAGWGAHDSTGRDFTASRALPSKWLQGFVQKSGMRHSGAAGAGAGSADSMGQRIWRRQPG